MDLDAMVMLVSDDTPMNASCLDFWFHQMKILVLFRSHKRSNAMTTLLSGSCPLVGSVSKRPMHQVGSCCAFPSCSNPRMHFFIVIFVHLVTGSTSAHFPLIRGFFLAVWFVEIEKPFSLRF
jgi:hypothetical protein